MLARSTAWRQGLGRAWTKATSIRNRRPWRTSRLAGLMSRWASPASHSLRMTPRPWSMIAASTVASPSSVAVEELGDQQVLAFGGELDKAVGGGAGEPSPTHQRQGVVLLLDQPLDGVERLLVLEAAIQQLPAQLVPA